MKKELPITDMPTSVRIGYHVYAIKELNKKALKKMQSVANKVDIDLSSCCGRIIEKESVIYISLSDGPVEAADTLLHEILHGITYQSGVPHVKTADSEYDITMFAHGLSQVMQDNPEVFLWIMENIKLPK